MHACPLSSCYCARLTPLNLSVTEPSNARVEKKEPSCIDV